MILLKKILVTDGCKLAIYQNLHKDKTPYI